MSDLLEMMTSVLGKNKPGLNAAQNMMGPVVGIVTNTVDPDNRYRVKVKYPWLDDKVESFWARIASPLAGKGEMGAFFLPEVDDEVLVQFYHGNIETPVITGFLYNGTDCSPRSWDISPDDVTVDMPNNKQGGNNDFRGIRSRAHHQLVFNDKGDVGGISLRTKKKNEIYLDDDNERIQVYDQNRTQWLEIDVPGKKITIQTDTGEIYMKAKTKITLECEDYKLKASNTITVESGASATYDYGSTWDVTTGGATTIDSGGNMTQKAPKIDLNP